MRTLSCRALIVVICLFIITACTMVRQPVVTFSVKIKCSPEEIRCFESVQAALDEASKLDAAIRVELSLGEGEFREKVTIARGNISMRGQGQNKTKIHFDLAASNAGHFYKNNWGTPGSATLTVKSSHVLIKSLSIENRFDYIANDKLKSADPNKIHAAQAVALLLDEGSDKVRLNNVSLVGYQDTLFAHGEFAHIKNSRISGNVDFIFGSGQLLIEKSDIISRSRGRDQAEGKIQGFITAPSTNINRQFGIVIYKSNLLREQGVPDKSVTLGRPWHPTTTFEDGRYADPQAIGQVSFIDCYMDAHIHPDRWSSMHGTARDGSKSLVFYPEHSRFHEQGSFGPGAPNDGAKVLWKPDWDVKDFFIKNDLGSWN